MKLAGLDNPLQTISLQKEQIEAVELECSTLRKQLEEQANEADGTQEELREQLKAKTEEADTAQKQLEKAADVKKEDDAREGRHEELNSELEAKITLLQADISESESELLEKEVIIKEKAATETYMVLHRLSVEVSNSISNHVVGIETDEGEAWTQTQHLEAIAASEWVIHGLEEDLEASRSKVMELEKYIEGLQAILADKEAKETCAILGNISSEVLCVVEDFVKQEADEVETLRIRELDEAFCTIAYAAQERVTALRSMSTQILDMVQGVVQAEHDAVIEANRTLLQKEAKAADEAVMEADAVLDTLTLEVREVEEACYEEPALQETLDAALDDLRIESERVNRMRVHARHAHEAVKTEAAFLEAEIVYNVLKEVVNAMPEGLAKKVKAVSLKKAAEKCEAPKSYHEQVVAALTAETAAITAETALYSKRDAGEAITEEEEAKAGVLTSHGESSYMALDLLDQANKAEANEDDPKRISVLKAHAEHAHAFVKAEAAAFSASQIISASPSDAESEHLAELEIHALHAHEAWKVAMKKYDPN